VEVRIGPSEIRSAPLLFNTRDAGSSQSTRSVDISGDQVATTSRNSSMSSSRSSEEDEGTCGRVSVVVLELSRSGVPVDKGGVEATGGAAVGQTNEMVAHSLIFFVVSVGQVSFSPGDGSGASSGVLEASGAVSEGETDAEGGSEEEE